MKTLNKSETRVYKNMCAELYYALSELQEVKNAVSVFGSARTKPGSEYYNLGYEMGKRLAQHGYTCITGGGPGEMEAANKGALNAGAPSVGLNIVLPHEQKPNDYQTLEVTFKYFAIRKVCFVKYSKAFIVCPGGFGSLDELYEVLTLIQNGGIKKCPVILLGKQFWLPMYYWMKCSLQLEGMISQKEVDLISVVDTPLEAISIIQKADK
jgi:uncharacterized protein (TIGR00730 family)